VAREGSKKGEVSEVESTREQSASSDSSRSTLPLSGRSRITSPAMRTPRSLLADPAAPSPPRCGPHAPRLS
jgi:hypothetical protein